MTEIQKQKRKYAIIASFFVSAAIALIILVVMALGSLAIEPDLPIEHIIHYPYTTEYLVEITPDETIHIGSLSLNLSVQENNSIYIIINEDTSTMNPGESKEITERRAQIYLFGIPIFETNYRINVTYLNLIPHSSLAERYNIFLVAKIETTKQIPEALLSQVMPVDISFSTAA